MEHKPLLVPSLRTHSFTMQASILPPLFLIELLYITSTSSYIFIFVSVLFVRIIIR